MRKHLLIFLFLISCSAFAQLDSVHYFPPMKQQGNNQAIREQRFYLSTPETTAFDVNVFQGTNTMALATITISNAAPGTYNVANGDNNITLLTNANTGIRLQNSGLRFEAANGTSEFYVNYRGRSPSQAASLTTKGTKALGTSFKWGGIPLRGSHTSLSSYLGIMATENGTIVDLTGYDPQSEFRLAGDPDGLKDDSYQIMLDKGETFVFQAIKNLAAADDDGDPDTANEDGWLGASITSNKKIAISNGGLNVGVRTNAAGRDAGIDQPVPENVIGQEYVFIRGNGANETEFPIIVATQDNTDIFVNGSMTPIATINEGEYFEIPGSNYSSTSVGGNMYVRTSRDAYAYQSMTGASQYYTLGLNFIAPVNCLLPSELSNISDIRNVAGANFNGGVTITASQLIADGDITVTHGGGTLTGGTNFNFTNVAGSTWKTAYVGGLTGNVEVNATGPIAVGFLGVSGAAGIAGYFSGFDTVPAVEVDISGGGCFPGSDLTEINGGFANYAWYKGINEISGTLLASGPTLQSYNPNANGLGEYFVRVTDFGGCEYNSAVVSLYSCDPDLQVTKVDNADPIDAGTNVTFTITAESNSVDPITNVTITDVLPAEFDIVSTNPEVGMWTAPIWTIGTMVPGDSYELEIVARAKDDASGTVTNSVAYNFTEIATETNILVDDLDEPVTINPCNTSSAPSSTPTLCVDEPLTNITHTTNIATGIGTPTGLPAGVTASWNADVITISGTPTASGIFNYDIPLTGGCNTISATGTITVNGLPIADPITGDTVVCVNNTIDLTEGTTGVSTNWSSSDTGVATVDTNGIVTGVSAGSTNITYTVTDSNGCESNPSSAFTVTVNAIPVLTSLNSNTPICEGDDAEFQVVGSPNAVLTYNFDGNSNQTATLDGAGQATLTNAAVTSDTTINLISLEFTATSCSINLTDTETVVVDPNPTLTTVNDQIECIETPIQTLDANNGITFGPNISVQWFDAATGGNVVTTPTSNVANAPVSYYAEITDTTTFCINPIREEVTLHIVSPPFPNFVEQVCSKESLNVAIGAFTATYTVVSSDPTNVPAAANRTTAIAANITDSYTNTTGSAVTITYTVTIDDGSACDGEVFDVVVTVDPEPFNAMPPMGTVCSDVALSHDLNSDVNVSGASFTWSATDNTSVLGETLSGGTSTSITDTLTNTSGIAQVVLYTITPTSAEGCIGDSYTYEVTVNPEPFNATAPIDTVCSDVALSHDLTADVNVSGGTFSWVAADNANVTGETLVASSATDITDTLTNTSGSVQTVVYTITPTSALGCVGDSYTYEVTVNPEPFNAMPPIDTVCSDDVLSHDLTGDVNVIGTTFSWVGADNANVTGETLVASSATDITDTLTNTSGSVQTVVYTITPTSALGCVGDSYTYEVTVNPEPFNAMPPIDTVCSDDVLSHDLIGDVNVIGTTFSWIAADNTNVTGETLATSSATDITDTLTNTSGSVQTVVYTITPTSTLGCVGDSYTYEVTVNPEPFTSIAPTDTVCSDTSLSYDLTADVNVSGGTFSWVAADNANVTGETLVTSSATDITDTLTNTSGSVQTVVYTITPTSALGCVGDSYTYEVTVNPEPFNAMPPTDTVCSDIALNHDLTVDVNLTGVTFSWVAADNANVTGETLVVSSATDITDTLTNTSGSVQTVVYTITPTSALGCVGDPYTYEVTVNPEPFNATAPTDTVCSDVALAHDLTGDVNLTGVTFSWVAADNANVTGETLVASSATDITDTLTNTSGSVQTVVYTITSTSALGCLGDSYTYEVTVNPEPFNAIAPTDTVCSDVALAHDLTADVNLTGVTFSWVAADNANVSGETLVASSATDITDTLTNTSGSVQTVVYTITPTSALSCVGDSYTYEVTINPEPFNATEPIDTVCSDIALNHDLTADVNLPGVTFSWVAADNTNVTGETLAASIATDITDTLTNTSGSVQTVVYTITPTSALGCVGDSYTYEVTVNPEPFNATAPTDTVCSDIALAHDLTGDVNLTGATFSWVATDNANVSGETLVASSATDITDTLTNTSGSVQTVVYTITPTSALGCVGDSYTYEVTVNPEPFNAIAPTDTVCSDVALAHDLTTDVNLTGVTFSWVAADNANVAGETLVASSATDITDTLTNISGSVQTVVYTITPTSALGCVGDSYTYEVKVNPEPFNATAPTDTVCSDVALAHDLTADVNLTGVTFSWVAADNANVAGETLTSSNATDITDTLTNTSGSVQTVVYTITPTSALGCAGDSYTYEVTVTPEPFNAVAPTDTVCSDVALTHDLTGDVNVTGVTFSWVATDNTNITGETLVSSSATDITDTLTNTSGSVQTVVYTITPTSALGCVGDSYTYEATVNPEPFNAIAPTDTVCSDVALAHDLTTDVNLTGVTFSWVAADNANIAGETLVASSATDITDTLTNISGSVQTVVYTITPTSALGCTGDSYTYEVTVDPQPVLNSLTSNSPICEDEDAEFTVSGSPNSVLTYNIDGNANQTITLDNSGNATITNVGATVDTSINLVSLAFTGTGCTTNLTNTTTVTVNPHPVLNSVTDLIQCVQSPVQTLDANDAITFNPNISIQWFDALTGGNVVTNPTTNTENVPISFYAEITDTTTTCVNPVREEVTLHIVSPPFPNFTEEVCSRESLNIAISAFTATYTVSSSDPVNVPAAANRTTAIAQNITDTYTNTTGSPVTITYTVTIDDGTACDGETFDVIVTVNPEPFNTVAPTDTVCSDVSLNHDLTGDVNVIGTTFSWMATDNPLVSGETLSGGTATSITDTLTNTSGSVQTVAYTITPTSPDGCDGDSYTYEVTVNPEPFNAVAPTETVCSDVALSHDLSTDVNLSGVTFSWVATDNTNVSGETISTSTTNTITDTLTNISGSVQTVIYTITPTSASGCVGDSFIYEVTVNPEPFNAVAPTATVCSDVALNHDLTTDVNLTGVTFSWVAVDNTNITGETTTVSSATSITDTLTNISGSVQTVVYTITPTSADGCVGDSYTYEVTIDPKPFNAVAPIDTVCSDIALNHDLLLDVNLSGVTFSWVAADNTNVSGETTTMSSATSITDTLTNISGSVQTVMYTITPTSADGCVGDSFTYEVTVNPEPFNTVAPTDTVCSDVALNHDLSIDVNLSGVTFSWLAVDNTNISGETTTVSSATSITDTLTNISGSVQTVVYTITPTSADGCVGDSFTYEVTVDPEPFNAAAPTDTVCSDEILNHDLNTDVNLTGVLFSWIATDNPNVTGETLINASVDTINDTLINTSGNVQTVVYTITPTSAAGCIGNSFTYTVTVDPQPVLNSLTSNSPICEDEDAEFYISGSPNSVLTYNIDGNANQTVTLDGTGNATITNVGATLDTAINLISLAYSATGCTTNVTNTTTVMVNPHPVLNSVTDLIQCVESPIQTLDANDAITFNPNISVQWFDALTGGNVVSNPILNTVNAPITYYAEITDTTTSCVNPIREAVTLHILSPPFPNFVEEVCSKENLNVAIGSFTAIYTVTSSDPINVPAATNRTTAIAQNITDSYTNTTGAPVTITYTVTIDDGTACDGETFDVVVTVNPEPFNAIAPDDTVCSDVALTHDLTTDVNVSGATFSWMATDNPNVSGETLSGGSTTIITDTLTNTSGSVQTVVYTIIPTSANGCTGEPYLYTVMVSPEPFNAVAPIDTVCSDITLNHDLNSDVNLAGASFSWVATDNTNVTGETLVASSTTSITDTLTNISGSVQTVVYTITPTSDQGCIGDSYVYTVTVDPEPFNALAPLDTVCSDESLSHDLTSDVNLPFVSFSWLAADNADVSGETLTASSATSITDVLTNTSGSVQTVVYTITPTSVDGCVGDSYIYTVTVDPEPFNAIPPVDTVCSDVALNHDLNFDVNVSGATFSWIATDNTNVTGETLTTSNATSITDTLTNISGSVQTVVYTITSTSADGCVGDSYIYTVTLNPEPFNAIAPIETVCSDVALNHDLNLDVNVSGATFSWLAVDNPNVTGETLVASSAVSITDTLTNISGIVQTVVYTITPTSVDGCLGDPFTYSVTINPEPFNAIPPVETVCSDTALSHDLTADVNLTGATFSWLATDNPNVSGETTVVSSATSILDVLTNTSGSVQTVVYTITPTSNLGCMGDSYTYTVTVDPEPFNSVPPTETVCSDVALNHDLNLDVNVSGSSFSWLASDNPNVSGETLTASTTTAITDTLTNISGSVQTVVYTITSTSTDGCIGDSYTYTVTVDPEPFNASAPVDRVCSDMALNHDLNSDVNLAGVTFSWIATDNPDITGETLTTSTTASITDTLTNISGSVQTVVYTITPTSADGCVGDSYTYTVTIDPEPFNAIAPSAVTCSGIPLNHNLALDVNLTNVNFSWQAADNPNVVGETITASTASSITDTLVNTSSNIQTLTYTITPTSIDGCVGNAYSYTVTLNPVASLQVSKTFSPAADGSYDTVGEVITYTISIENTNEVVLSNVSITDANADTGSISPASFMTVNPFQTVSVTATHTITQQDLDAGEVVNTAEVIATDSCGTNLLQTSDDPNTTVPNDATVVPLQQNPSLSLEKIATFNDENGDGFPQENETISYDFTVTNTGNVSITNIQINDALITVAGTSIDLLPTEFDDTTFTGTYTITQADIDSGSISNSATVVGEDPNGDQVIDTSDDPNDPDNDDPDMDGNPDDVTTIDLLFDPEIVLTKTGVFIDTNGDGLAQVGETIAYSFEVLNTGNVTVSNIEVTDPLITVSGVKITLSPGQLDNTTFTGVYTLTQADVNAGSVTNTATVSGVDPNGVPVSDTSDDPTTTDDNDATVTTLQREGDITLNKLSTFNDENGDGFPQVGETITYNFEVRNTGNVTVSNITISDNLVTVVGGAITLNPNQFDNTTFTAIYTITQNDINAGGVTNSATATGQDPEGNPISDISDDPLNGTNDDSDGDGDPDDDTFTSLAESPSLSFIKTGVFNDTNSDGIAQVGETITYSFEVTNTGNVTISGLTISDPLVTVSGGPISLDPTQTDTTTFTAVYTLTQTDIDAGNVMNSATVNGNSPQGTPVSDVSDDPNNTDDDDTNGDGDPDDVTETAIPGQGNLSLIKTTLPATDGAYDTLGEQINYVLEITNTGNVTISNIIVTDANADVGSITPAVITSLAPGVSTTVAATHTITQDDLNAGEVNNTAQVTGEDPSGNPVSDISDDPNNTTDNDADGDGDPDDETTTGLVQEPSMSLEKVAVFNDESGDGIPQAGETITYNFRIKNTGNVSITNISITDPLVTVNGGPISLDPTEVDTNTFFATYTILQSDLDAGSISNSATVNGEGPGGTPVEDTSDDPNDTTNNDANGDGDPDDDTVFDLTGDPGLRITKIGVFIDGNNDGLAQAGETIQYSFDVTNTGNVTVSNITVNDPLVTVSGSAITLTPGQTYSTTFTATYVLLQSDVDQGNVINTATASGVDPEGNTISDTSDDPTTTADNDPTSTTLARDPKLTLFKTATFNDENADGIPQEGETISYVFDIRNTGNVTLNNIVVTDPIVTVSGSPISLPPAGRDATTFSATYVIQQADIDAGNLSNSALVTGEDNDGGVIEDVSDFSDDPDNPNNEDLDGDGDPDDPTVTSLTGDPQLTLNKIATFNDTNSNGVAEVGETITYAFEVINSGNVSISGITITDPLVSVTGATIALLPGEADTTTFSAIYTITQSDIDSGSVSNSATVSGTDPNGDPVQDTSDDPTNPDNVDNNNDGNPDDITELTLNTNTSIQLTKEAIAATDGAYDTLGEQINYQIVVTNMGNTTLKDVVISDNNADVGSIVPNIIAVLTPGQSITVSAIHTITQVDLDSGAVSNTAMVEATNLLGDPVSDISDDPTNTTNNDSDSDGDPDDITNTALNQTTGIVLTKAANAAPDGSWNELGEIISYTLTVENTGNVTLSNVVITDANADTGSIIPAVIPSILPGQVITITASHTITQTDIDTGSVTNTAMVSAKDPNGNDVTDQSDDPNTTTPNDATITEIIQEPEIAIIKTVDNALFVNEGDVLNYTITVTNIGQVTLENVSVSDNNATILNNNVVPSLAPGVNFVLQAQHIVTRDDIIAGVIANTAIVSATLINDPSTMLIEDSDDSNNSENIDIDNDGDFDDPTLSFLDTDGDDVVDVDDFDDDNDGILDTDEMLGDPTRDTDGDGIIDRLDLESDGDGLWDYVESGHKIPDTNGDGRLDGPVGTDGVPDSVQVDPNSEVADYELRDTDGDGIDNFQDIDDDNDGLLTIDENPDPNGDGVPDDAIDTNVNGIANYLEVNNADLNAEDGVEVFNGVSANQDGTNDFLIISGLENLENTLRIYNRWGVLVYETTNYGRTDNFFRGISNGRVVLAKNKKLPVGTYFYVLDYTNDEGKQKKRSGYLYLNR